MPNTPRYEKLKQLLKEKLMSGQLKVGDRFFSQNELIKKYGLSFSTVTRALNELEHEGFLIREQGRGTFVNAIPGQNGHLLPRTRVIAVFIPWDFRCPAHINYQKIYNTIEASLPSDCEIRLIPVSLDATNIEKFIFSREAMDGLIFVYPLSQHMFVVRKLARMYPTVVIGHKMEAGISYVRTDNQAAAEAAVDYLIRKGHCNIGMISGGLEMTDAPERLEGYRQALKKHDILFRESLVLYTHPVELNGYGAMIDLFDRNTNLEITAVFAAGDVIAMGVLSACRSMNKQVPADVSVMGFDDIDEACRLDPPLTTIHVPMEELAKRATNMLLEQIDGGEGTCQLELPAHVVERASVRRHANTPVHV